MTAPRGHPGPAPLRRLGRVLAGVLVSGVALTGAGNSIAGELQPAVARGAGAVADPAKAESGIVELNVSRGSGVVSAWLGNGVRLHHRQMAVNAGRPASPTGPAEPRVLLCFAVAGGELHETELTRGHSAAAAVAWRTPATRTMDSAAMAAHLRGRRIRVGGYATGDALVLRLDAPAAELGEALRLAALMLTEPVVEPGALASFAAAHADKVDRLAAADAEPRWIIPGALREVVLPGAEPRFRPVTPERLRGIDAAAAQAWLDAALVRSPAPLEASIVGDIPVAKAMRLAEPALGTLPVRERISPETFAPKRATRRPVGPVSARVERPIAGGRAGVGVGFFGADGLDMTTHRALSMAAQVLDERLTVRIRERGWGGISDVITVASPGGFNPGESGLVLPAAMVAPRHADAAAELIAALIADFAASGPTPDEFRRAGSAMVRDMSKTLADPAYWSAVLAHATYRGSTPDDLAAAIDTVNGFSMDDLTSAVRRHAAPERSIRLIIEPSKEP